jgi:hypothetical protein
MGRADTIVLGFFVAPLGVFWLVLARTGFALGVVGVAFFAHPNV